MINNEKESFDLIFDTKTKKVTKCDQLVFDITESELPGTVQASLDTVYSLSTEVKNLKLRASTMYSDTMKGERQSKTYYFRFSDGRKVENSNKEFDIKLDETGKVQYFDFTKLPLVNIKGNTKEEKAQNLLKRLYREEANEYKIQKINEISKDDPNYKEYVDCQLPTT